MYIKPTGMNIPIYTLAQYIINFTRTTFTQTHIHAIHAHMMGYVAAAHRIPTNILIDCFLYFTYVVYGERAMMLRYAQHLRETLAYCVEVFVVVIVVLLFKLITQSFDFSRDLYYTVFIL